MRRLVDRVLRRVAIAALARADDSLLLEILSSIANRVPEHLLIHSANERLIRSRYDAGLIARSVKKYRGRFRGHRVVYCTDRAESAVLEHVDVMAPEDLLALAGDHPAVVILGCEDDQSILAALASIKEMPNVRYAPLRQIRPPAAYFQRNRLAREILTEAWSRGLPKFERTHLENLIQGLELTRSVDGVFVEVGAYKGTSAYVALRYMAQAGLRRPACILDTFTGFDYPAAASSQDAAWFGTHGDTSRDGVAELLGFYDACRVLRCDITQDELPPDLGPIALAHVDVDLEEATLSALRRLAPLIEPSGLIVMDDSGHTPYLAGAYYAQDVFLHSPEGARFLPIHLPSGQNYLIALR